MKKLITIIAILSTVTAFGQDYNKEKDALVASQVGLKPVKTIVTDGGTVGKYYDILLPEIRLAVLYSQITNTWEISVLNLKGEEIVTTYAKADKSNKISTATLNKIKQKVLAIK